MTIYPAILTDSQQKAQIQLDLAQSFHVSGVQLDIIDGYYADNITLTPADYANLNFGQLQIDFHLMTEEPMDYVYEILDFQKQLPVRAIIGQVERMTHQKDFLTEIKKHRFLAGLSLNLFTPLDAIDQYNFEFIDVLQIMAVRAGFQGQTFHTQVEDLIKRAVDLRNKRRANFAIIVDGGVKQLHLPILKTAGVDAVVVGSAIWQAINPQKMVKKLKQVK